MMVTPVFFVVGIPRQSDPTEDRKEQANTCCCQAEEDADPDCNRHTEKHPKKTCLVMALVDVTQSRNNAEQRRAKIRQRISKQCKAPPFRLSLTGLEVIEMLAPEESIPKHRAEPVQIWKARKFIKEHSDGELSLRKVAKAVNISANHFSEKFKHVTGMNFVEYVAGGGGGGARAKFS